MEKGLLFVQRVASLESCSITRVQAWKCHRSLIILRKRRFCFTEMTSSKILYSYKFLFFPRFLIQKKNLASKCIILKCILYFAKLWIDVFHLINSVSLYLMLINTSYDFKKLSLQYTFYHLFHNMIYKLSELY